jgi:hypothetical protein
LEPRIVKVQHNAAIGERGSGYDAQQFLIASVNDIQATIRAIDLKANALMLTLAVLIGNFDKIGGVISALLGRPHDAIFYVSVSIVVLLAAAVALSVWLSLWALSANYDPTSHVEPEPAHTRDAFFIAQRYRFSWTSVIFHGKPHRVAEKPAVSAQRRHVPSSLEDATHQLVTEQLKLAYIRDLKMRRINASIVIAAFAILFFAGTWACAFVAGVVKPLS